MTRLILIGLAPMFWFNYFSSDTPEMKETIFKRMKLMLVIMILYSINKF